METNKINKDMILEYLKFRGVRESMIFGDEKERVDPIDRHIFLRDMYINVIGYHMTNKGMLIPMPDTFENPVYADMHDFDEIQSIDDAVINLKFLAYAKEPYQQLAKRRLEKLRQRNKVDELER